ncbi:MAG: hypothetical protein ABFD66_12830, partial [Smithella sp.]
MPRNLIWIRDVVVPEKITIPFITDFDTDFPESLDGDMFPIFIMAIDGQEDVSDQSCQHLDHQ